MHPQPITTILTMSNLEVPSYTGIKHGVVGFGAGMAILLQKHHQSDVGVQSCLSEQASDKREGLCCCVLEKE